LADRASVLTAHAWGGGALPYDVGHKKLGMWLFILSDSLTFSALLVGYSYVRVASPNWPTPFPSSLTMVMAVGAAHRGDRRAAVKFIWLTILGGLGFIVLHVNEWLDLIHEGVRLWQNPWGAPLFGATFFTLTGLHMTHVASGMIYLAVIAAGVSRGRFHGEDVEVSGLYWHFVDLVWMFIFPLVYLLSVGGN
jgi:cytochrome c oxidase subunit 3